MPDEKFDEELRRIEKILFKLEEFVKHMSVRIYDDVADLKRDVGKLKSHDVEFQTAVNLSCTLKSKEIDDKIEKSEKKVFGEMKLMKASLIRMIIVVFGIQSAMFGIFIGAVVYMNNEHGTIYEKINDEHKEMAKIRTTEHEDVVENGTNINTIIKTLDKMNDKIDKVIHSDYKKK